ncbi:MAG: hypothetical protein JNL36_10925 [Candidatus Kapabacteria bacterium]|nr:hypothetical protein [Candidatus Kapabacteria bacterium]
MRLLYLVVYFFSFQSILFAQTIDSSHFNTYTYLITMDKYNDKIAVLGYLATMTPFKAFPTFNYFENGTITPIKNTIVRNSIEDTMRTWQNSKICFDKNGTLYFTDDNLYKYNGTDWEEFSIDDNLKGNRKFGSIVVDIENNLWITTTVSGTSTWTKGYSELYRFKDGNFELAFRINNSNVFYSVNQNIFAQSLTALSNGTIIVQIDNIRADSSEFTGDVVIVDQKFTRTFLNSQSSNNTKIPPINRIQEINNNQLCFLFNKRFLGFGDPENACCSGISTFNRTTNEWKVFDQSNNLQNYSKSFPPSFIDRVSISENEAVVSTSHYLYSLKDNNLLSNINWKNILPFATIYKMTSFQKFEYFNDVIFKELNKDISNEPEIPAIIKMLKTSDNKIAILVNNYMMTIPISTVTSINEISATDNQTFIITENFIRVDKDHQEYSNYTMYDVLCGTVASGSFQEQIPISTLPSGVYILRLIGVNKSKSIIFNKIK